MRAQPTTYLGCLLALAPKAALWSTDPSGTSWQGTTFGETGTLENRLVPSKSSGPVPCKCRRREHAGTAKNSPRGLVSLRVKSSWIIYGSPGMLRHETLFDETGSQKIARIHPKSPGPMSCKCRPGKHACMAKNLPRGTLSLMAKSSCRSSTDAPGTSRQGMAFGETESPEIPWVSQVRSVS